MALSLRRYARLLNREPSTVSRWLDKPSWRSAGLPMADFELVDVWAALRWHEEQVTDRYWRRGDTWEVLAPGRLALLPADVELKIGDFLPWADDGLLELFADADWRWLSRAWGISLAFMLLDHAAAQKWPNPYTPWRVQRQWRELFDGYFHVPGSMDDWGWVLVSTTVELLDKRHGRGLWTAQLEDAEWRAHFAPEAFPLQDAGPDAYLDAALLKRGVTPKTREQYEAQWAAAEAKPAAGSNGKAKRVRKGVSV